MYLNGLTNASAVSEAYSADADCHDPQNIIFSLCSPARPPDQLMPPAEAVRYGPCFHSPRCPSRRRGPFIQIGATLLGTSSSHSFIISTGRIQSLCVGSKDANRLGFIRPALRRLSTEKFRCPNRRLSGGGHPLGSEVAGDVHYHFGRIRYKDTDRSIGAGRHDGGIRNDLADLRIQSRNEGLRAAGRPHRQEP